MKNQKNFTILVFLFSVLFIQATSEKSGIAAKTIETSVCKITETLYAGECEVSNWWYKQFLHDLSIANRTKELSIAKIDSTGWITKEFYIEPFVQIYHVDKKYDNYPVVNISFEAANLFCSWLTDKYNSIPNRKFKNALFRLPNEKEWMLAAKGNNEKAIYSSTESLFNAEGLPIANYRRTDIPTSNDPNLNSSAEVLAPVKSYWPNEYLVYNMSGNASEMISTQYISKGGSFLDIGDSLKIQSIGHYQHSSCKLGFRYFMEILSN